MEPFIFLSIYILTVILVSIILYAHACYRVKNKKNLSYSTMDVDDFLEVEYPAPIFAMSIIWPISLLTTIVIYASRKIAQLIRKFYNLK